MIRFQALMQAIHKSIHSATQAVEAEGVKHIETFFDEIPGSQAGDNAETKKQLDEAHEKLNAGDVKGATTILAELKKSSNGNEVKAPEQNVTHRPKMVAMAFPNQTPSGVESVVVNVPLITLSPISTPRVKEVKITADLEVTTDENDDLHVAFPGPQKKGVFNSKEQKHTTNTHIEISLEGTEPPEGLQKVIEGYERALRAQIPG